MMIRSQLALGSEVLEEASTNEYLEVVKQHSRASNGILWLVFVQPGSWELGSGLLAGRNRFASVIGSG